MTRCMGICIKVTTGCLLLAGSLHGWYRYTWPYGPRTCFLPCLVMALRMQAEEKVGRYPDDLFSTSTIEGLRSWGIRQQLAGLSGDLPEAERRLQSGLPLDTNVSSWVFVPGFRTDDPGELAILWDRQGGLAFNAHRAKGYAVGFVDGSHRLIPTEEWPGFLKAQEELRARVLASRRTLRSLTNAETQK